MFISQKLTIPTTTYNSLSPSIKWYENPNFCLVFEGNCLKRKKKKTYTPPNRITFFFV